MKRHKRGKIEEVIKKRKKIGRIRRRREEKQEQRKKERKEIIQKERIRRDKGRRRMRREKNGKKQMNKDLRRKCEGYKECGHLEGGSLYWVTCASPVQGEIPVCFCFPVGLLFTCLLAGLCVCNLFFLYICWCK